MSNLDPRYAEEYNLEHWEHFVEIHQELYDPIDSIIKAKMSQTKIPKDIQIVLLAKLGDHAIPALDHKTPISYLQSAKGTNALRAAIMCIPN